MTTRPTDNDMHRRLTTAIAAAALALTGCSNATDDSEAPTAATADDTAASHGEESPSVPEKHELEEEPEETP